MDNVAHELRTPLTAVGGYAEYIQRAELSEEEKYEAAQYIVEEANRLAVMSERLLQMAALRGEQAARESVDVPALLEKAARTVAPKAAARGVALEPVQADACTCLLYTSVISRAAISKKPRTAAPGLTQSWPMRATQPRAWAFTASHSRWHRGRTPIWRRRARLCVRRI